MSTELSGGWSEVKVGKSNVAGVKAETGSLDNASAGMLSELAM